MDEKRPPSFFRFDLRTLLLAVGLWCVFLAIWNRPSIDNMRRVRPGMIRADVLHLIGEPREVRHTDYELWYWGGDNVVRFDNGKVTKVCVSGGWRSS
jgi:hypothetical protein